MNTESLATLLAGEHIVKCNIVDDIYISFYSEENTHPDEESINERSFTLQVDWGIDSLGIDPDNGTKIGWNVDDGSEPVMYNFEEVVNNNNVSYLLDPSNRVYDNDGHWFVKLISTVES